MKGLRHSVAGQEVIIFVNQPGFNPTRAEQCCSAASRLSKGGGGWKRLFPGACSARGIRDGCIRSSELFVGALDLSPCFIQSRNQPLQLHFSSLQRCAGSARVKQGAGVPSALPCPVPASPTSPYEHLLFLHCELGSRERVYRLG